MIITISKSTLKRRLALYGLNRASNVSLEALRSVMEREMEGPNALKGYRGMWNHLRQAYGLRVKRDTVMELLREIDPEGVKLRRTKKLNRRAYVSPGPNYCWHFDGYDKLKPYGLPIHGCIDGFSRKILWLKVVKSNNNPVNPAFYYLSTVKRLGFCPKSLRTDCGTENGIAAGFQCFFLQDKNAHCYGTSTANQRIECWWSHCKKSFYAWVIDYFKQMVADGILQNGNKTHLECIWFVYAKFLQVQLDEVV